jgi:glycosyltransferase involved in cell wall biosynthesis
LPACKNEAKALGVENTVTFHGRLPRPAVDEFYAAADVFLFPSFREPGGIAVIEAMSYGLGSIVADRGGPAFAVDDSCGIRVPVTEPEKFASQVAEAISMLAQRPQLLAAMGKAARQKVERQFLWDVKVDRITHIYDRLVNYYK